MPIYEFYCRDCNTIFDFYSKTVNTEKIPSCPMCNREKLERHVSMFSSITGKAKDEESAGAEEFQVDEARLERAVGQLSREAESINEDDPRQAALLMRKFSEMAGIRMGTGMEEALARMEAGEDPEQVEAEMGQLLDNEDFMLQGVSRLEKAKKNAAPGHDKKLYEL